MGKTSIECAASQGIIESSQSEGFSSNTKFDGKHLHTASTEVLQKSGSSGLFTNSKKISFNIRVVDPVYSECTLDFTYKLIPKNRSVMISSSIDPTYKRVLVNGVPTQVVNQSDAFGNTKADTLYPDESGSDVVFMAVPFKNWNSNSDYHWFSSLTENWEKGGNAPSNIEALKINYKNLDQSKEISDHIFLRVNGKDTSHDLKSNYYLKFHHNGSEDWHVTKRVEHPLPFVTKGKNPEWGDRIPILSNYTNTAQIYNRSDFIKTFPIPNLSKIMESISIENRIVTKESDTSAFKTYLRKIGRDSTSSTNSMSLKTKIPPYTALEIYFAPMWTELSGICSEWDQHGYRGEIAWLAKISPNRNNAPSMATCVSSVNLPRPKQ